MWVYILMIIVTIEHCSKSLCPPHPDPLPLNIFGLYGGIGAFLNNGDDCQLELLSKVMVQMRYRIRRKALRCDLAPLISGI